MVITSRGNLFTFVMLLVCLCFAVQGAKTQAQDSGRSGIWMSDAELSSLPVSGDSWKTLLSYAQNTANDPDLRNQDDKTDTNTLAKALVYARTGNTVYAEEVVYTLRRLLELNPIARSLEWDALATCRSIGSYAIAADLINLKNYAPDFDKNYFRPWLDKARFADTEGGRGSIVVIHESRPNNYGTHASASRIAASLYLGDQADLGRAIQVFRGWLGDRTAYSGFKYGDLSWQADPAKPVGINPKGSSINGYNVDGVLPDDQRRGGTFSWPPPREDYVYEGLQGVVVSAELLHRAGYPAFEWSDRAILRAMQWLHTTTFKDGIKYPAAGDDVWQMYVINKRYGTTFPTGSSTTSTPGKMVGYTDWTHSAGSAPTPAPQPAPAPAPEPEPVLSGGTSTLSLVSARFWSTTGNLEVTLKSAAPGATIQVLDTTWKAVTFGKAPGDGSQFTLRQQFYTANRLCTYAVTDGVSSLVFEVTGSSKFGCGPRR